MDFEDFAYAASALAVKVAGHRTQSSRGRAQFVTRYCKKDKQRLLEIVEKFINLRHLSEIWNGAKGREFCSASKIMSIYFVKSKYF